MESTALVYSSHNRCNYIHNDWIVQRALRGNKKILFLPMSEGEVNGDEYRRQKFSWGNFEWFFNYYRGYGLDAFPFYWNRQLRKEDADILMDHLRHAEVVILGGGNPWTGMNRYRNIGRWFYNDHHAFRNVLLERQYKGLLTAGFSAGSDQLCQIMSSCVQMHHDDREGFGLCRNMLTLSHFQPDQEAWLGQLARDFGHCLVFGLPNDSGLAVSDGWLPSGNIWQLIHFITDNSWDKPSDHHHIKTRQGMAIQHKYADGRHWGFNGGDTMLRLQSPDNQYNEAFFISSGGPIKDYWTQNDTGFRSYHEILQAR